MLLLNAATFGCRVASIVKEHRNVSRRIHWINKRMEQEIGENIITKHGHKRKLIPRLRRDFAAGKRIAKN